MITIRFAHIFSEQALTPEDFAEGFCADLDLPEKFESYIAASIKRQVQEQTRLHEKYKETKEEETEAIFVIRVWLIRSELVSIFSWIYQ